MRPRGYECAYFRDCTRPNHPRGSASAMDGVPIRTLARPPVLTMSREDERFKVVSYAAPRPPLTAHRLSGCAASPNPNGYHGLEVPDGGVFSWRALEKSARVPTRVPPLELHQWQDLERIRSPGGEPEAL
jgi:hypothetical protein